MDKLSTIATIAHGSRKPNKAHAFRVVRNLIASGNAPNDEQLAILYGYFQPAVPKKPKTVFDWVALALGKNDVRRQINMLHVKNGVLYATDGHRIHYAPTELADGCYDKSGSPTDFNMDFASVERIISDTSNQWCANDEAARGLKTQDVAAQMINYCDSRLQGSYFEAVMSVGCVLTGERKGALKYGHVHFTFENDCKAVIMPTG